MERRGQGSADVNAVPAGKNARYCGRLGVKINGRSQCDADAYDFTGICSCVLECFVDEPNRSLQRRVGFVFRRERQSVLRNDVF